MSKRALITAGFPLPENDIDGFALMGKVKPAMDAFKAAIQEAVGSDVAVDLDGKIVRPVGATGPRKKKSAPAATPTTVGTTQRKTA